MNVAELGLLLERAKISVASDGETLRLRGTNASLNDPTIISAVKANKEELLAIIRDGGNFGFREKIEIPKSQIPDQSTRITPDMIDLVSLSQEELDRISSSVPGGASNIRDIYPLVPLQEGMLLHHIIAADKDPYVLTETLRFPSIEFFAKYVNAINEVIARHDILRTCFFWDGITEPVQVVLKKAAARVFQVSSDHPAHASGDSQCLNQNRFDLSSSPLWELHVHPRLADGSCTVVKRCHHILLDGHTTYQIDEEIRAFLASETPSLPTAVPYRAFVEHVKHQESNPSTLEHFKKILVNISRSTTPFGSAGASEDNSSTEESFRMLDGNSYDRVLEAAKRHGLSVSAIIHAAYGITLSRVSDTTNPVFGTVLSGRMNLGSLDGVLMGPTINTLPFVLDITNATVIEAVRAAQGQLSDLVSHEHAALGQLTALTSLPPGTALFSAIINFRQSRDTSAQKENVLQEQFTVVSSRDRSNYPITVLIDDLGLGLAIRVQCIRSVSPDDVIDLIFSSLQNICWSLIQNPNLLVSEIDILPQSIRDRLLYSFSPPTSFPDLKTVNQWFDEQVRNHPHRTALTGSETVLTYGELDDLASRVTAAFRARGLRKGAIIGVSLKRSQELVAVILGIFRAGGIFLPLDPSYPRERTREILSDSSAEFVVTGDTPQTFETGPIHVLNIKDLFVPGEKYSNDVREPILGDPAYVLYTSGSTGKPKGVVGSHRALAARLAAEHAATDKDCVFAFKTSINSIDALWEIFLPLTTGAGIHIVPPEATKDPMLLAEVLRDGGVTHTVLVPSLLDALLNTLADHRIEIPSLRHCASTGETLPRILASRFAEQLPNCTLVNLYGTTEVWDATSHSVVAQNGPVPIGKPFPNMRIFVIDEHLRLVPPGVEGEIAIAGDTLAAGYLGKPDLTAERFIPCPFQPGQMYRTGDVGRWDKDGVLAYHGRGDRQVNVRGFRVELGEVERQISDLGFPNAVVLLNEDTEPATLTAYVVADPRASLEKHSIPAGLFFFSHVDAMSSTDALELYIKSAQMADQLGFACVWTPERHFTKIGAIFPNPAVTSAALAVLTSKIQLRSGSVVLPLHDPVRVAEEWSVVDHLSNGRIALSFASGWVPDDFALAPDRFSSRQQHLLDGIEEVRNLWAGRTVQRKNGVGDLVAIGIEPRPITNELPTWLTSGGTIQTFLDAGRIGANVLTHLFNMTLDELKERIAVYRHERQKAGHDPNTGVVTVMVHTYVRNDAEEARALARPYLLEYFRAQLGLRQDVHRALGLDASVLPDETDDILSVAVDRFIEGKTLIGSPTSCSALLSELEKIGANEIACLVDFGLGIEPILDGLTTLDCLLKVDRSASSTENIRNELQYKIPDYMIPDHVLSVARIPLLPNGKVDRSRLPQPTVRKNTSNAFCPPRTSIERSLCAIWSEILGVNEVGIHDSFFDLGGNSLKAIRVTNQAQKVLRARISVRDLFQEQTIAKLAASLSTRSRALLPETLIPLKRVNSEAVLCCIHGGVGASTMYAALAARLRSPISVSAIQYPGLFADRSSSTIAAMAKEYVDLLRKEHPDKRYVLLGWSFGGLVAYECARELIAHGDTVSRVLLLDTHLADASEERRTSSADINEYLFVALGRKSAVDEVDLHNEQQVIAMLKRLTIVDSQYSVEDHRRQLIAISHLWRLRLEYMPVPLECPLSFIGASDIDIRNHLTVDAWRGLSPSRFTAFQHDGDHYEMFSERHIEHLAEIIDRALENEI